MGRIVEDTSQVVKLFDVAVLNLTLAVDGSHLDSDLRVY